jgi:hypothetical protein
VKKVGWEIKCPPGGSPVCGSSGSGEPEEYTGYCRIKKKVGKKWKTVNVKPKGIVQSGAEYQLLDWASRKCSPQCGKFPLCREPIEKNGSKCTLRRYEQLYTCSWTDPKEFYAGSLPADQPTAKTLWADWLTGGRNQVRAFASRAIEGAQRQRRQVALTLLGPAARRDLTLPGRDRMLAVAQAEFVSRSAVEPRDATDPSAPPYPIPSLWEMDWEARLVPFYIPTDEWDHEGWLGGSGGLAAWGKPGTLAETWEELAELLPEGERTGSGTADDAIERRLLVH